MKRECQLVIETEDRHPWVSGRSVMGRFMVQSVYPVVPCLGFFGYLSLSCYLTGSWILWNELRGWDRTLS